MIVGFCLLLSQERFKAFIILRRLAGDVFFRDNLSNRSLVPSLAVFQVMVNETFSDGLIFSNLIVFFEYSKDRVLLKLPVELSLVCLFL